MPLIYFFVWFGYLYLYIFHSITVLTTLLAKWFANRASGRGFESRKGQMIEDAIHSFMHSIINVVW